ncbi:MAG: cystathionine beta-lyase [Phenylobacterium sp.]|uniref:cystathionine beta-lyase n=1 Tax=Phenylobacterium sp. TaxID=1871053 RepID=UPI0025F416F3|nr:cystathionine beta-lyase [Phenylobacterium sp.]MCA6299230.1 cystathionine beta-lyase [Phenylobacterium sp.]
MRPPTRLVHPPKPKGPGPQTVNPVIQKGSTVLLPDAAALYDDDAFVTYGRAGLGAHEALKVALCDLEQAASVELYPSGVAAIAGALLAVMQAGDELLMVDTAYKPTRRFCDRTLARFGVQTRYYDPTLPTEAIVGLMGPKTRALFMESPGSLSFEMQDVPALAAAARARGVLTLIDNTWGAGHLFKPLEHGVDVSLQSLTKYVGGHSDAFMGSAAARDPGVAARLQAGVVDLGWSVAAEDAYAMLRGLRTLDVRLRRHGESGLVVAEWLQAQDEVAAVLHPALPGAPGHELWKRDFSGACGLFALVLRPAPAEASAAFLDALKIFGLGFSWGGFESLAIDCDPQLKVRSLRREYGGGLVRLHIGLEDPADLIADLERALTAFRASAGS